MGSVLCLDYVEAFLINEEQLPRVFVSDFKFLLFFKRKNCSLQLAIKDNSFHSLSDHLEIRDKWKHHKISKHNVNTKVQNKTC